MSKQLFDDFLKREDDRHVPKIDWDARKKEWLSYIDQLYSNIEGWLKDYTADGRVKIRYATVSLTEAPLGTYETQEISIQINNKTAILRPLGTILIGTRGRIDLIGRRGTIRFILADKNSKTPKISVKVYTSDEDRRKQEEDEKKTLQPKINWTWKISSNPPNIKYTELNQDSFLECLLEVVNG